jgi:Mrp family chromosome partitioning ATPase
MQHLKNPDDLIWASRRASGLSLDAAPIKPAPAPPTPDQAWARLTEIRLDPIALARNGLIHDPKRPGCDAIDMLRTRTLRHLQDRKARRIAITSPSQGSGKSTIAANLALSLGRREDLRTILFDFNLRAPVLIHRLGLMNRGPRFSALLNTRRAFDSSTLRLKENLAFSLSATPVDAPAEVLAAKQTKALIAEIEKDFKPDVMIFDLPAIRPGDDAVAGLGLADCALLVARANVDKTDDIDDAEKTINEHTSSLGVVINDCGKAQKRAG